MTLYDIHAFLTNNGIDYSKRKNKNEDDVLIHVPLEILGIFMQVIGSEITDENSIKCELSYYNAEIWMKDILGYHDIELNEVFN